VSLLEERDVVVAGIDVAPCRREQAFDERRSENSLLARERLLQFDTACRRLLRQQAPRVCLRVPEPDEHVLDPPPDPLGLGQPAEHRLTRR
jgi:hypothetical protein